MNEQGNQIASIPPNSCILAPAAFKRIFFLSADGLETGKKQPETEEII